MPRDCTLAENRSTGPLIAMPFRARLHPSTLARRAAARAFQSHPLPVRPAAPAVAAVAGPGPGTLAQMRTYRASAPTQAFSFFRRKAEPIKPADAVMATLGPGLSGPLAAAYDNLVKWIEHDADTRRLTGDEMERLMSAIAGRRSDTALELMLRVYGDLGLHGLEPEPHFSRQLVYALARHGQVDRALALLQDGAEITSREWTELMRAASKEGKANAVLALAEERGAKEERLYAILLHELNNGSGNAVDGTAVQQVMDRMERNGVEAGLWTESALVPIYIALGDIAGAKKIADSWPTTEDDDVLRRALLSARCEVEIARRNVSGLAEVIRTHARDDGDVPTRAVAFVINAFRASPSVVDTMDAVHQYRRETGVRLSPEGWRRLILSMPIDGALEALEEAKMEAAVLDEVLARALITQLCDAGRLDDAMRVYDELTIVSEADPTNEDLQPSMDLYRCLLGASAREGDIETALNVLEAVKERGLRLRAKGEQLTALIGAAPDHMVAMDVYDAFRAVTPAWDAATFSFAISAFIRLRTPSSAVPPPDLVIGMMNDMRRAGFQPGAEILTTVLASYAALAKRVARLAPSADSDFKRTALLSATRDVRTLVSLDPLVAVNLHLLNALMNALSCTGAYAEALSVWSELLPRLAELPPERAAEGEVSIAIAIDTCAFGGQLARARKIWGWATRHNMANGLGARSAWIECLCRFGKYEEAVNTIKAFPGADIDLAAIVVKFAFRSEQTKDVFAMVRDAFPQWWGDLSKLIKSNSSN